MVGQRHTRDDRFRRGSVLRLSGVRGPEVKGGRVRRSAGTAWGGRTSLIVAGRVTWTAWQPRESFHGGGLVTDDATSPHLLADQMKATVYVAGRRKNDGSFTPEQAETLDKAPDCGRRHAHGSSSIRPRTDSRSRTTRPYDEEALRTALDRAAAAVRGPPLPNWTLLSLRALNRATLARQFAPAAVADQRARRDRAPRRHAGAGAVRAVLRVVEAGWTRSPVRSCPDCSPPGKAARIVADAWARSTSSRPRTVTGCARLVQPALDRMLRTKRHARQAARRRRCGRGRRRCRAASRRRCAHPG